MEGGLSQDDLARLMARVDEQLALGALRPAADIPSPALDDLAARVGRLRQMRAPLLAVSGRGPAALLRRLVNVPLLLVGFKQRSFNQELLEALDVAIDLLRAQQAELAELRAALPAHGAAPPEPEGPR